MAHDVRLLRSFVVLAEELHFGRAATRLHITQPALSRQLQRLEEQLGFRLLDRGRGTVGLTADGTALLEPARTAVAAAHRVEDAARELQDGSRGEVSIGFSPGAHLATQTLLEIFGRQCRGVRVRAVQQSSRSLADQVRERALDLALGFCTGPGEGYVVEPLFEEPAVLAVADAHVLAGAGTVWLPSLREETFALVDEREGPGYNSAVLAFCRAAGFEPAVRGARDGPMAWESAVRGGACVGLTTRSTARSSALGIRLVPLTPVIGFPIELVLAPDGMRPTARRLADLARALAAAGELGGS